MKLLACEYVQYVQTENEEYNNKKKLNDTFNIGYKKEFERKK